MTITNQPHTPVLPDQTTVGRVRLRVADLERSLVFYRDFLEFVQ